MTTRPTAINRRDSASVHPYPQPSSVSIVLGAQWGDEVSLVFCSSNFHNKSNKTMKFNENLISRAKANWSIF